MSEYRYIGDRFTLPSVKGTSCNAVRINGKCVRGKNGNMLVEFDGIKTVVIARLLRKL